MNRVLTCGFSLFVVLASSSMLLAQEAWPTYPLNGHNLTRGPGNYFSPVKLALILFSFWAWVRTTSWVNSDTQILKLNHNLWNPIVCFPFLATFLVATLNLPFAVGFTGLVLSWLIPLGVFIYQRNANVEQHEKVLTPDHLRHVAGRVGKKMGMDVNTEKKASHEKGAPVELTALSAKTEEKNQANMILARQSGGYVAAKDLLADAIDRRSDKLMMDFEPEQVVVRYQIDGVWHEADAIERETGDSILEALKRLANCNPQEQRKRQTGKYKVAYKDHKFEASLVTQGTKTGERAIIHLLRAGLAFATIAEAGMRSKMQERLKELFGSPKGLFIYCSVPNGGLSTMMALSEKLSDRYMRDFASFQDVTSPEPLADNIDLETYDPADDNVQEKLTTLFRKDPDVVIVHELLDKEMADLVCQRANDGKLIFTSIRAKEAVEGLLRVLLLKVAPKEFASAAIGVLNQRLIRKLCEECREEYAPSLDLLKKLGIPGGRVDVLYRPPEADDDRPVCKACGGLGYTGRTSIFELVVVDDSIREALIKQPKLEVLRKISRKSGNRTLQEEGIALVAQGITSLAELQRVLKG